MVLSTPYPQFVDFPMFSFVKDHGSMSFLKLAVVGVLSLGMLVAGGILIWFVTLNIPSIESFHTRKVAESTKIYDRTGRVLLYDVHGTIRRTLISLDEVSHHAQNATIAIEDTEFYQHIGIKPDAILRAVLANIRDRGYGQGGSTITQQVVKNTMLSREKTITRKIKEWILAIKLEKQLPKDKILEIYFNETPYGGTIYGIEEASQYFFAKAAKEVTLAEAAYLAALPQAPTYYSPFGNHRDELEKRKNLVLQRMFDSGFITAADFSEAKVAVVGFQARDETGIKAPHFVFYVREYLEEKYGPEAVMEGGLTVVTTLDYALQKHAEEVVERYALENEKTFNAENAALVAIDPKNGHIVTMVGSRGYFDEGIDGKFNITLAKRQPGSSFKPFVYATAFAKGYTPDTAVFDLKTQFSTTCEPNVFETNEKCYSPDNYDGVFRGPVSLRDALAQSINIPAVKVLYLVGIPQALETARRLGITTLTEGVGYYGLPLVLGGGEVTLLEMVGAYSVFANDGVRHQPVSVLKIEAADGTVLEEHEEAEGERVLDAEVARTTNSVLADNAARTPAFGENSSLYFPGNEVAAKTGTTNDYRDAWVIGYTPNIAIGAWAGNNNNTPMSKKVAGFIVAPLWNEVMRFALNHGEHPGFTAPPEVDQTTLPPMLRGAWNEVGTHDILHSVNKDNPRLLGANSQSDLQYPLWEYPIALWSGQNPEALLLMGSSTLSMPPAPIPGGGTGILITYPQEGQIITVNGPVTFMVQSPYGPLTKQVTYLLNGISVGTVSQQPFSMSLMPTMRGAVRLTAIAEGESGRVLDEVQFTLR